MSKFAIYGGEPLVKEYPKEVWPIVEEEDIEAVVNVLRSGRVSWIFDEETKGLENEWAEFCGAQYGIAMNSGTAALHAAVAAAGIGPGDEVIVPALTFLASASAVIHHQGIPIFVDVDPYTYNIDAKQIEAKITNRTKAIMPVHLHGLPADMDEIMAIARKHGLIVIEDASQAQGALYKGRRVGGIGDMAGTSIMAGKNFATAGEAGMFTTSNPEFRDHADMVKMFGEVVRPDVAREYNAQTMGWNYRLSNIVAAFARTQLRRLQANTEELQVKVNRFTERLRQFPGILPPHVPADRTHVYHHYRFLLDPKAAGLDIEPGRFRKAIQDIFNAEGLKVMEYQNRPIPGQALFRDKTGYGRGCPWSCGHASPQAQSMVYDIYDYPQTLWVIERSLVVGGRLAFANLFNDEIAKLYLDCFEKIWDNLDRVQSYAASLDYHQPWEEKVRLA